MCANTNLDTPSRSSKNKNINLSENEGLLKEKKAQDKFNYLVKTKNKLSAIVRFK